MEVPNGVDLALFVPHGESKIREYYNIPATASLLLFIAALDRAHHFKGLEHLLQVIPNLSATTWLLIVGDGDLRATFEAQAEELGISDRVRFAGNICHENTPAFFRAADITVLPS